MDAWRVVAAAVTGAVLAVPPVAGTATQAAAAPVVPCPVAKVPVPSRPPKPSPPPLDSEQAVVGGDALATPGLVIPSGAPKPPSNTTATSWIVADLDTGEVLGACGPHQYSPPASVQKLLLAATVMGKLDPAQVVTVTRSDLDIVPGSSAVGLLLGGKYTVATLWLGLLLNSGNDAANALARVGGGAGGVPATLTAMNAEAQRLGAYQTHAVTPSGLDGTGQFTSAYDLALIARVCFARADFRKYDTTLRAQIPAQPPKDPRGFQIQNENLLLTKYPGALGGKTGFTDLARHTYVGAAQRNGRRLVVTLLGAEPRPVRGWQQGAALLDWGFTVAPGASVGHLVTPDEVAAAKATPTPENAPAGGAAGAGATGAGAATANEVGVRWYGGVLGGVALVAIAVAVALVVANRSRRRRVVPVRGRRRR